MTYEKFKEALLNALKDFYGDDAEVLFQDVVKVNDVHLDGINIIHKDKNSCVNPVIYANSFYERYTEGEMTMDDIVGRIIDTMEHNQISPEIYDMTKLLSHWNTASEHIYPMLVHTDTNKEMLEKLVSTTFLDLSVIYYIRLGSIHSGDANVKITHQLFDSFGVSLEELHERAISNLRNNDCLEVKSMADVLRGLLPDSVSGDMEVPESCNMHVLSNRSKLFGAAHLLDMDTMPIPYRTRSYYVIPSSIHEAILVDDESVEASMLNEMIQDVNDSVLSPEEILSSHCYYYDGASRQLSMCA